MSEDIDSHVSINPERSGKRRILAHLVLQVRAIISEDESHIYAGVVGNSNGEAALLDLQLRHCRRYAVKNDGITDDRGGIACAITKAHVDRASTLAGIGKSIGVRRRLGYIAGTGEIVDFANCHVLSSGGEK